MADLKLRAIISVADRATAPLKNINRQLGRIQTPFRNLGRQLKALDRNSGFRRLRQSIGRLASQAAVATGAIGGIVAGIFGLTNKFAEGADQVGKMASKIGFGVEALQEWRFAADRSGVSAETLNSALVAFTKRMGEARAGTGGLFSLLKRVNPAFLEQLKAAKSNEEAFNQLLAGISRLEDPTQRAALAAAAFSRAGVGLVNIAKDGVSGMDALRKRARELGLVLDAETVAAAEKFQDSMTDARGVMSGLFSVIGSKLLPVLQPLIDQFTAWAIKNKDLIATKITKFVEDLADNFDKFTNFLSENEGTIQRVWDAIGGMRGALVGLGVVVASPLLAALAGVLVAALSPAGLIAGALIAAGAAGLFLTKKIQKLGDTVRPVFQNIGIAIGKGLADFGLKAKFVINEVSAAFRHFWNETKAGFASLWDSVTGLASKVFQSLIAKVSGIANKIRGLLSGPLGAVRDFFGGSDVSVNQNQTITQTAADPSSALIRPLQPSLPRQSAQAQPSLIKLAGQRNQDNQTAALVRALQQSRANGQLNIKIDSDKPTRVTKLQAEGMTLDVDSGLAFAP